MKKIYIYVLIDPFTDEIRYVGKTTNLVRRLSAHVARSKKNKYHSARWVNSIIHKGSKPIIKEIEECDENTWADREKYWISYYKEIYDLTNILDGGDGGATYGRLGKPWSDEQRKNNKIARTGLKVNHTDEGNKNREAGKRKYYDSMKKTVYQYSLEGVFIKEWGSAVDAGKSLNINNSNITRVCRGKTKKAGEFLWSYEKINLNTYERKPYVKAIIQKDANGDIINEYDSIKNASIDTNISRTAILNCLGGLTKSSGGFIWEYKNNINNKN